MSALIHLVANHQQKKGNKSIISKMAMAMSHSGEAFWFALSLVLFLVMGPFSVIAVIAGLYQIATSEKNQKSQEPISC